MFNLSLFRLSMRQIIGRHRLMAFFFLIILAALPGLIAALIVSVTPLTEQEILTESARQTISLALIENFVLIWIVPALALFGGANILREEIHNHTIEYLYLKPVSRVGLVLSKFTGGMVLPVGLTVLSIALLAAVFGDSRVGVFIATGAVAALSYGAVFFALSLFLNRTVLWAFGYLALWENFLFGLSRPASFLSVKRYVLSLTEALRGDSPELSAETSLTVLVVLIILSLAFSAWRLRTMEFPESTE
jgi:ABC-type transport system involved in multi-copper enzyme maturation permease subunit